MKILVTGAAGYIGSTLVPYLIADDHEVTVLDNFMYRQTSLNHLCHHPKFHVVKGDIRVAQTIVPLLRNADVVIPLAALVGAPICNQDPIGATTTNHDAILMMLSHLSKDQIVLMPTTNSAYGSGVCNEDSPLRPISKYARDKVEVEKHLMDHPNAVSLRLATVFGMSPRMRLDLLVNDFVYRAVNDRFVVLFEAHFKRNYVHVRDVCRVFRHALANIQTMKGQIYNVGLPDSLSKLELCQAIQKRLPEFVFMEAPVGNDLDQRNYIVSNDKIHATGFQTVFSLDSGIQELIKGYAMLKNSRYGNA